MKCRRQAGLSVCPTFVKQEPHNAPPFRGKVFLNCGWTEGHAFPPGPPRGSLWNSLPPGEWLPPVAIPFLLPRNYCLEGAHGQPGLPQTCRQGAPKEPPGVGRSALPHGAVLHLCRELTSEVGVGCPRPPQVCPSTCSNVVAPPMHGEGWGCRLKRWDTHSLSQGESGASPLAACGRDLQQKTARLVRRRGTALLLPLSTGVCTSSLAPPGGARPPPSRPPAPPPGPALPLPARRGPCCHALEGGKGTFRTAVITQRVPGREGGLPCHLRGGL